MKGRLDAIRLPFYRMFVKGTDAIPALSQSLAADLRNRFHAGEKAFALSWGPDLDFYPRSAGGERGVIAAGRTGRDFQTFGMAATEASCAATIVCLENQCDPALFGQKVVVKEQPRREPVPGQGGSWMKYPDLIKEYRRHRVIAIPLAGQETLAGLTGFMDALGLGKPVIMTRNRHIDVDIEAEGIGLWVEPGDAAGWVRAIRWMDDHEDEALAMGGRARRFAERKMNSVLFAEGLMDVFDGLLGRNKAQEPVGTGACGRLL